MTLYKGKGADEAVGLNPAQIKAVEHNDGPLLIIAGAGTGKTRVITHRIARLIEKGTNPSDILALTFTEKAAHEMEERVDRLVPYGYSTVRISTFHAFGDRILRDNALSLGLTPDFSVLGTAESVIFLREHLFDLPLDYYRPSGNPTKYLYELTKYFARLKDEDVSSEEYLKYVKRIKESGAYEADFIASQTELAACYAKYSELMAENGFLDFGDQVTLTLKLFREHPSILKRYANKFKYILADEFQDTNYAQFELIKLLSGDRRNVTVVADDDQSIYKFRGAAISNVLNFKDVYKDAVEITLTENYRSGQPVLDASYRLITHNNPDRLEVKSGIDKRLVSANKKAIVKHLHYETLSAEAEGLAQSVLDAVKNGRKLKDIAVLVRANNDALPYLSALSGKGIANRFSGSSGLYERDEIRLLISFLRSITDRNDALSLFHLATSPIYGLTAEELIPCHNLSKRTHRTLLNVLREASGGATSSLEISLKGMEKIRKFTESVTKYSEESLSIASARLIYNFITETGYLASLADAGTEEAEFKVRNIAKFLDIVSSLESTLDVKNAHALTSHLGLLMESGDDPATAEPDLDADCVQVMTVHKSKGLEFPIVYMVGLTEGRFPRTARRELLELPSELIKDILPTGDFHVEEERRLFYVGMTRAMEELYLSSAVDYGKTRGKKPSRFILEAMDTPQAAPFTKLSAVEAVRKFAPPVESIIPAEAATLPEGSVVKLTPYEVDDYMTCPLKYRYVHVLRVPLLPHHTVMYGSAMHAAVNYFFSRKMEGLTTTEDELIAVFKANWRSEGFVSKEHEDKRYEEGVRALKNFLADEKSSGITPACVEKSFSADFGTFVLAGRWDLIEERESGPCVIDFKTSDVREKEKADEKAKKSMQLKIYSLGYEKEFGRLPASCELHFIDHGIVGTAIPKQKDLDRALSDMQGVADGIRKREFAAKPDYLNCSYCAFNNICRYKAS